MGQFREPDLLQVVALANVFDVSKEAAARAYAQYHEQLVAVIVAKDGQINRIYRDARRFPRLSAKPGMAVPATSLLFRAPKQLHRPSSVQEANAGFWLESDWGRQLPELYEQVFFQRDGFALIMLWTELSEDEADPEEDKTSKQRLAERQARWRM